MLFKPTPLKGSYEIELDSKGDDRGFFARLFCSKEFALQGLHPTFVQINNSFSAKKGTLRGMHYQLPPMAETKIVRCIKGSLYDVILDLRDGSPTFGHSYGTTLSAQNRKMIYVPKGFAHGFLTLEDETEILYFVSEFYSPKLERGVRWNDSRFAISWPQEPKVVSDRDRAHPDFDHFVHLNCCTACTP